MVDGDATRPWYRRTAAIAVAVIAAVVLGGAGVALVGGDDGEPRAGDVVARESGTTGPDPARDLLDCSDNLAEPTPGPPQPPSPAPVDDGPQTVRPQQPNTPSSRATEVPPVAESGDPTVSTVVEDVASIGEPLCVEEYAVAVTGARIGSDGQVAVSVVIENDAGAPRSVNPLDWRLVTESDAELGPTSNARDDALEVGELGPGERVDATVLFGAEAGTHLVVFQPDPTDDATVGAWRIDV